MLEAKVYNSEAQESGSVSLKPEIFGVTPRKVLLHQYVNTYLANQRQGTHNTKTRAEVSGGGKKPWRQKGTGRARAGSNTSPIWVRGGSAHGPKPRDYGQKMPHKAKRLALKSAFSLKAQEGKIAVIEPPSFEKPQTKSIFAFLSKMGVLKKGCLILNEGRDQKLPLSCRNIPNVKCCRATSVNAYDLLTSENILFTRSALQAVQEAFAG